MIFNRKHEAYLYKEAGVKVKVGVLSDTHIPMKAKALSDEVIRAFQGIDHIIHAGDIGSQEVLDECHCKTL